VFQSVIIGPDRELCGRLQAALEATGYVEVTRTFDHYPTAIDLVRALRAQAAELLFVSFESVEKAQETVRLLEAEASQVQVVAFDRRMDLPVVRESMRIGLREFLVDPFEQSSVLEALDHLQKLLHRRPASYGATDQIFSFLPSKAGVGTSTIALNVSAALARMPDTGVLLSDFDLTSGMIRFMLKLSNTNSVTKAIENATRMDEQLWPQLVSIVDGLEVLHAGRVNPNYPIEPGQIRGMVAFMRRNYKALCFDLSGNLEPYSLELMQESKRIVLVCTSELPSLHLAREKMQFLRTAGLDGRISVVLNRVHQKTPFNKNEVEKLLEAPVVDVFPNDYVAVNLALAAGTAVPAPSTLGLAFSSFAANLIKEKISQPDGRKSKFLDFFTIPPRPLTADRN
jgi:Flp pilus assembly CpaE family ATPase